ncbi:NADPH-dependent FMN reductase family protein [Chitinimonas naiadis]
MNILLLSGSPSVQSRSAAVLRHSGQLLEGHGFAVQALGVRDFPSDDLVQARFDQPSIRRLHELVAQADGLVIATPVYKAAYAGTLKLILDVLPERALLGKVVLPIATGGTLAHMLAIDYALKPVLSALSVKEVQQGVYGLDKQIALQADGSALLEDELAARLDGAVRSLVQSLGALRQPEPVRQAGLRLVQSR